MTLALEFHSKLAFVPVYVSVIEVYVLGCELWLPVFVWKGVCVYLCVLEEGIGFAAR